VGGRMKCSYCGKEEERAFEFRLNLEDESVVLYFCRKSNCFAKWVKENTKKLKGIK